MLREGRRGNDDSLQDRHARVHVAGIHAWEPSFEKDELDSR
jgi:hypothetical protein